MTPAMARTSSFPLYDELKYGGRLGETLLRWRDADGLSLDDILVRLREDGVQISRSTVGRWLAIADERAQVAS